MGQDMFEGKQDGIIRTNKWLMQIFAFCPLIIRFFFSAGVQSLKFVSGGPLDLTQIEIKSCPSNENRILVE